MFKSLITVFNWISVITWATVIGFLSLFSLGSMEDHKALVKEPVNAFLLRFLLVGLVGLFGIAILTAINYILNKFLPDSTYKVNLKKLFVINLIIITAVSLVGTLVFIYY